MPERRYLFFFDCRPGQCEVISIDYDIAVAARTLDEAKAILEAAIGTYIEDAMSESEPARSCLLNRRMPWMVRLHWTLRVLVSRLNLFGHPSSHVGRLEVACRA